ncbi:MAG: hypothetical protein WKF75_20430 [Singulisphaera sp.]
MSPNGTNPRPVIYWGDRPSDHVTNKALAIYQASNLPKIVFAKGASWSGSSSPSPDL